MLLFITRKGAEGSNGVPFDVECSQSRPTVAPSRHDINWRSSHLIGRRMKLLRAYRMSFLKALLGKQRKQKRPRDISTGQQLRSYFANRHRKEYYPTSTCCQSTTLLPKPRLESRESYESRQIATQTRPTRPYSAAQVVLKCQMQRRII